MYFSAASGVERGELGTAAFTADGVWNFFASSLATESKQ